MTASNPKPVPSQGIRFPKALAAAGLAAVLVGCGGGSSDTAMDEEKKLSLPTDGLPTALLPASETISIPAGESRVSGGVMFSCAAGGAPCQVTIDSDGTATSTGGTVMASLTAAAQHLLNQNTANANRDAARSTVDAAISVATSAIIGINNESTESDLESAQEAINNARESIQSATALTQDDKNILLEQVGQQQRLLESKEVARTAYLEEEKKDQMEDEDRTARTQERQAADMAISTAFMQVDQINNDSSPEDLEAAQNAINAARTVIEEATHLSSEERARRLDLVQDYQDSFDHKEKMAMDAMNENEKNMKMAKTKAAMDLYSALDAPHSSTTPNNLTALDNTDTNSSYHIEFTEGKLMLRIAQGAAGDADFSAEQPDLSLMPEANVSSAALDDWTGEKYGSTNMDTKVEYEAVVYTNRDEPTKKAFLTWASEENFTEATTNPLTALGLEKHIQIDEADDDHLKYIESPVFEHPGKKTHTLENGIVDGSFNGVSGKFRCDSNCTSDGNGSSTPEALGGTWTFYPSADGMVDIPDDIYLIYGWWVRKDMDGMPTAASAFFDAVGDNEYGWQADSDANDITGSASYTGKAVGKFAIHDPFNADLNNSGHFTADAELKANFGLHNTGGNGVTGTIDNFRLNDMPEGPNWSVTLDNSTLWTANGGVDGPSTTWSIDGIKAESSGSWNAKMFDHTTDDDIDFPTTTVGEFYSEIDSRYRMVGAFAAEIEE